MFNQQQVNKTGKNLADAKKNIQKVIRDQNQNNDSN
jgi:hypothetical protein